VPSRATKRREAWQLIAWVGTVVAGLLILDRVCEGALCSWTGAMAPLMTPCRIGDLLSVVVGGWSPVGGRLSSVGCEIHT
jgi:hypothetical protein